MPSIRAKVIHKIFKFLFSSDEPLTMERLLKGRKKTHKFGHFVRTFQPVKQSTKKINGITDDIIEPKKKTSDKIIVYLHGGGFVYGMSAGQYELVNRLALQTQAKVLVLHYSLAPESRFPTQIKEVTKVYSWLLKHGYKSKKIFFAGDSAGGNLSITSSLFFRDNKIPLPAGIIAMSPVLDGTFSYSSF